MLKKITLGLLFIGLVVFSFDLGRRWELSKAVEYCLSVGKKLSYSGPAYCIKN